MPVRVLLNTSSEKDVLAVGEGVSGEAFELEDDRVLWFSDKLAGLGQGVTGVALIDDACLPVVTSEYFKPGRAPWITVRQINRADAEEPHQQGSRRFFVFSVPGAAGFQFALSLNQVLEVVRELPLTSLNFQQSHLTAVAVWRGETIPVVDLALAARLGEWKSGEASRILVVRNSANQVLAIPVTGQVRQHGTSTQVYAPDSGSVRPMRGIRGIFRFEGSPLLVPDLDALIG